MAAAAQVKQLAWDDQARALMQASADASPWAMVSGFGNALNGSHLFCIEAGGQRALVALRGTEREHGRLLEVVGLRSLGDRMRADVIEPAIVDIARGCYERVDLLSMVTRHAHLVRACERQGWARVATVVNKPLRLQ